MEPCNVDHLTEISITFKQTDFVKYDLLAENTNPGKPQLKNHTAKIMEDILFERYTSFVQTALPLDSVQTALTLDSSCFLCFEYFPRMHTGVDGLYKSLP